MPEVISDIVVSAAKLYRSPVGTALPLDTVDVDAAWPGGWVSVGYTLEPVKASYTFDVLDVMVQQEMGTVKRIRIKEVLKLGTVLAELTAQNMALAFAGETTTAAATATLAGYEEFSVGGKYALPMAQWGIEGSYVDADEVLRPIRVFVWKATAAAGGELVFNREQVAGVPLEISAPNIAEDKERIEATAFDTEVVEAFAQVVKQVYPLARLASALGGRSLRRPRAGPGRVG